MVMRTDTEQHARFIGLVQAHQGAIRKVVLLYARDLHDREELLQDIMLQLWRSFGAFRGESGFSTFLYRVALNTALMRLRRAYRRPEIAAGRTVEDAPAPDAARDDEEVERLHGAIRQLRPIDRAIVLLVLEEKSYAEIAAVTGLSIGNVSVRLVRSKEQLRKLLGAEADARKGIPCSTKT